MSTGSIGRGHGFRVLAEEAGQYFPGLDVFTRWGRPEIACFQQVKFGERRAL